MISYMLSNQEISFLKSLQQKKYRDQEGCFVVESPKVIAEHIKSKYFEQLFVTEEASLKYQKYWAGTDYRIISTAELKKISVSVTSQGAVGVFNFLSPTKFDYKTQVVLLLDGIQDPGNVGTIIRTADWFGVKDVFLNAACADIYNPKTVASTMGSILNINCYQQQDLVSVAKDLKKNKYQLLASDIHGKSSTLAAGKTALIIGSEAHGINDSLLKLADLRYQIQGQGKAESLNAAVAAGIILYQLNK